LRRTDRSFERPFDRGSRSPDCAGPIGVYDLQAFPFLAREISLLEHRLANARRTSDGVNRRPQGAYRGLSQHMGYGSYVAACAEVSVSDKGVLKIHRIVAATDPGHAVNPALIERQIAGSFS